MGIQPSDVAHFVSAKHQVPSHIYTHPISVAVPEKASDLPFVPEQLDGSETDIRVSRVPAFLNADALELQKEIESSRERKVDEDDELIVEGLDDTFPQIGEGINTVKSLSTLYFNMKEGRVSSMISRYFIFTIPRNQ